MDEAEEDLEPAESTVGAAKASSDVESTTEKADNPGLQDSTQGENAQKLEPNSMETQSETSGLVSETLTLSTAPNGVPTSSQR